MAQWAEGSAWAHRHLPSYTSSSYERIRGSRSIHVEDMRKPMGPKGDKPKPGYKWEVDGSQIPIRQVRAPSHEEIVERCKEVQSTWTAVTEYQRRDPYYKQGYEFPIVSLDRDIIDQIVVWDEHDQDS